MSFKIGSINMYKFNYRKDKEISKDIKKIVKVIMDEEFDIIGLQEVLNESVMKQMLEQMPCHWNYVWQAPKSRTQQAAEGYAFIWNTNRFRIATGMKKEELRGKIYGEKSYRKFMPRIHDQYDEDKFLFQGKLIRDPLYARFESVYGWYEIRLINAHIIYHERQKEDEEGDKEKRRRELEILMNICHRIESKVYRNARTSYTFLIGDYNLSISDIKKMQNVDLKKSNNMEVYKIITDRNGDDYFMVTVQHELSTLRLSSSKQPDESADGFANNYDHFTYNENIRTSRRVDLECKIINTVKEYWDNDFRKHRREFSDHLPIKLTGFFK